MHAAGIAPTGDPDGCRWVVVRHAVDHVHIVATTVRANLTGARLHNDWQNVMAELTRIEQDYGLRQVEREPSGKRTARTTAKRPNRAEIHKAKRQGRPEPSRAALRTAVRESLAGAVTEEEFLGRLAEHGILVKVHRLPSGDAKGYSFAVPGDRNGDNRPVWYSGTQLGPDLTLPRIRARLAIAADEPADAIRQADTARPALQYAGRLADLVLDSLTDSRSGERPDPQAVLARAAGLGEVLDALAQTHHGPTRAQIAAAAKAYGQAVHQHQRAADQEMRALRSVARSLLAGGPSLGRGNDGDAVAALLDILVFLAVALYRQHLAAGHHQHARTAKAAHDQLRTAYTQAAAKPLAALTGQGKRLPAAVQQRHTAAVRRTLPAELAGRVLAGTEWPALAATLAEAQTHGHDPATLLRQAVGSREMDTADNPAAVLLWRIRRTTDLPAIRATRPAKHRTPTSVNTAPTPAALPPAPPAAPRRR